MSVYSETAQTYVAHVRSLFPSSGDRGPSGPRSYAELAQRAEDLLPLSQDLTQAVTLATKDPSLHIAASTRLLAKVATELEICDYLYQAALDEKENMPWTTEHPLERSDRTISMEHYLSLIVSGESRTAVVERTEMSLPNNITESREMLKQSIHDSLDLILERTATLGQEALSGLMELSVTELVQATGVVGMDIAQALGLAEQAQHLYSVIQSFLLNAYHTLMALLTEQGGQVLIQEITQKVADWIDGLKQGGTFRNMLETFYETQRIRQALRPLVEQSQAELSHFHTAIRGVDALPIAYNEQITLIDTIIKKSRTLWGRVAIAVIPNGRIFMAALYTVLGSYVVVVGADYVDAPQVSFFDHVPGVQRLVKEHL